VVALDQSVVADQEGVVGPVDSETGRQGESKRASLVVPTRVWHLDGDPVQERQQRCVDVGPQGAGGELGDLVEAPASAPCARPTWALAEPVLPGLGIPASEADARVPDRDRGGDIARRLGVAFGAEGESSGLQSQAH
jgi:hypothetical protein